MTIRNIALDPGFGGFKAAEVPWPDRQGRQGDAVKVVTVPSVVGTGSTDLGLLDLQESPAGDVAPTSPIILPSRALSSWWVRVWWTIRDRWSASTFND